MQFQFSAAQLGHGEGVVDKIQQQVAGGLNFSKIIRSLRGDLLFLGKLGKADDGVKRRAHVVTYVGEKLFFGFGALLNLFKSYLFTLRFRLFRKNGGSLTLPVVEHGHDVTKAQDQSQHCDQYYSHHLCGYTRYGGAPAAVRHGVVHNNAAEGVVCGGDALVYHRAQNIASVVCRAG